MNRPNIKKFLIAYSGGMDSHVLLHKFVSLRNQDPKIQLRAVHIHHGLSPNADAWVEHCYKICADLNVELIVEKVDVKAKLTSKHSPEAVARDLRYQQIVTILRDDECLVTAHHADDQSETVLLQLFRGSGPKGLAAMPEQKGFMRGSLIRPLLKCSREELHQYAVENKLNWIEDESNENIGLDRNFVRHKLMPIIKERWPGILTALGRVAEHCAEASELLNVLAEQDYSKVQGSVENTLSIKKLLALSDARQNNLIRFWIHKLNLPTPTSIKLQHVRTDVLHCRDDAEPMVHWQGAEVRKFRDALYAMAPLEDINVEEILKQHNIKYDKNITVRFRKGGEKIKIKGRIGTHSLKKLMQEWNIPPWERDRIPLLYKDDELIAVIGYWGAGLKDI